jgi:hypothetical protein
MYLHQATVYVYPSYHDLILREVTMEDHESTSNCLTQALVYGFQRFVGGSQLGCFVIDSGLLSGQELLCSPTAVWSLRSRYLSL